MDILPIEIWGIILEVADYNTAIHVSSTCHILYKWKYSATKTMREYHFNNWMKIICGSENVILDTYVIGIYTNILKKDLIDSLVLFDELFWYNYKQLKNEDIIDNGKMRHIIINSLCCSNITIKKTSLDNVELKIFKFRINLYNDCDKIKGKSKIYQGLKITHNNTFYIEQENNFILAYSDKIIIAKNEYISTP